MHLASVCQTNSADTYVAFQAGQAGQGNGLGLLLGWSRLRHHPGPVTLVTLAVSHALRQ